MYSKLNTFFYECFKTRSTTALAEFVCFPLGAICLPSACFFFTSFPLFQILHVQTTLGYNWSKSCELLEGADASGIFGVGLTQLNTITDVSSNASSNFLI